MVWYVEEGRKVGVIYSFGPLNLSLLNNIVFRGV